MEWTDERGWANVKGGRRCSGKLCPCSLPNASARNPIAHPTINAKPQKKRDAQPTVLVGRLEDSQVGGPRDPPGRILHVVALPVDRPVLVGEAEGRLDVRAHVREHCVFDRNSLHLSANLARVQRKPGKSQDMISFPIFYLPLTRLQGAW